MTWHGFHALLRRLARRPVLSIDYDETDGREVYTVRRRVWGPAYVTSDRELAARWLEDA